MRADRLLAIDQGTSSTKALLVDPSGRVVASAAAPLGQRHPRAGWVEHDAEELWTSVVEAVRACLAQVEDAPTGVALSVQRESVLVWDRRTLEPLSPVLSWQDQRTTDRADALETAGHAAAVRAVTGLPVDPMFSALKAQWLLDDLDPDRSRSRTGAGCLGTVDAFLLARLGGPGTEPVTEIGCASRTQLLDLDAAAWSPALLDLFAIPAEVLPRVVASTGPFPAVRGLAGVPDQTPVLAVLADSHAALFAHGGWRQGVVKATYGTGTSVMTLGPRVEESSGVCSTLAWQIDRPQPALEANIRSSGRTMTWLAELFDVPVDTLWAEAHAAEAGSVHLVPAFGGLGAPYWDRHAVAVLSGVTLGSGRPQLARGALEAIAHQVDDVLDAFAGVALAPRRLVCDGGMTASGVLMQRQADLADLPVLVPAEPSLSALGAAGLAGVAAGWWDLAELERRADAALEVAGTGYLPAIDDDERVARKAAWRRAVDRSREPRHADTEVVL